MFQRNWYPRQAFLTLGRYLFDCRLAWLSLLSVSGQSLPRWELECEAQCAKKLPVDAQLSRGSFRGTEV